MYLSFNIHLAQGWSTSPFSPESIRFSPSSFLSNCKDWLAPTNQKSSDDSNANLSKTPVTVLREKTNHHRSTDLILNENLLSSTDTSQYNIHDYALFMQGNVLPGWWSTHVKQRPLKTPTSPTHSSLLWAKVRAVTYMTTLAHRTGSWYSDDRTEMSPNDDDDISSLSDNEGHDLVANLQLTDVSMTERTDLSIPLRRSYSSIDYVKHDDDYSSPLSRSRSTTLMSTPDLPSNPSPVDFPLSSPPPPPQKQHPTTSSSRVYRFLHCIIL